MRNIPIVIINYNSLTFLQKFIHQIHHLSNQIIIFDNASSYPALLEYYDQLNTQSLFPNVVFTIHRMDKNYGHLIYLSHSHLLPDIFILSDPDLQLPLLTSEHIRVMYCILKSFSAYKVGCALDISEYELFIPGSYRDLFLNCERKYYENPIQNDLDLPLFEASIDTTFCMVNKNAPNGCHIRIAGNYTAKHLPWYHNYLKENIPMSELQHWVQHNLSSSILEYVTPSDLGIH